MTTEMTVNGVRSPVLEHGPRDAREAVVFVHGNPGPKEDWAELVARLPAGVRGFAPDMPGYGGADRPRDFDYTVPGYAVHLGAMLDAAGIDRAHLVMHDFGGPWGLAWAARHRDRVGSLTLINTGVLRGYTWHKFARVWQTPILGELFMATANRFLLGKMLNGENPRPFPDAFVDRIHRTMDWGSKRAVLKLYRSAKQIGEMSATLADAFAGNQIPTLVVFGGEDPYIPARFAEVNREVFPAAAVHVLPGLGHWPFVDDLEQVASLVLPFLAQQVGGARAA